MYIPDIRVHAVNDRPVREDGDYVLYWMIAHRRTHWNFALERAATRARQLGVGLVVFEALRAGYEWASVRLHQFVIDGMRDNAARLESVQVTYFPYLEPKPGDGRGLLQALAARASLVVTDEFPCFFLPRMVAAAGQKLDVRLEAVDGNGLLPLRATEKDYTTAASLRRFLQKTLPDHLADAPAKDPLNGEFPTVRLDIDWAPTDLDSVDLSDFPIDQEVQPGPLKGGYAAGAKRLAEFIDNLDAYAEDRNHPDADASSGLSPYLHFGHTSAHQVFAAVAEREDWSMDDLAAKATGSREGWWGMGPAAESFLDELITWRELGYVFAFHRDDYQRYDSLPEWAKQTLAEHADDPREHTYTLAEFENAETHDELWNAAQRQLMREGRMHNYLRMLWGKKILEWTTSPRKALDVMIELNNRFALDGRNPNSYSGIFWILGRFDRGWPERAIYGKVRCMTSASTRRKVRLSEYLDRYAE